MCEISVVIPVYNKEKYLKDTVRSVSKQTFGDFELLLIDDGSTDRSGRICDELAATDSRIKVFHTENRGVSAARNLGIRKAEGTYISFLDADDIIEKTFLEKLRNSMEKEGADLAVCGYYEVKLGKRIERNLVKSDTGNERYEVLRFNLLCTLWNKLYVRKKIRHLFDERISTCEDSLFCARYYYDNQPKISYVNENLYGYLIREEGLTTSIQKNAYDGVNRFRICNERIASAIADEHLRRLAIHHIYRVYFYGIYMYMFENLCNAPGDKTTLSAVRKLVNNVKYRKTIKHIFMYSLYDRNAEKTSKKEFLYIIFSLMRMKYAILLLTKAVKLMEKYKRRQISFL